jgi:hypothetical protein
LIAVDIFNHYTHERANEYLSTVGMEDDDRINKYVEDRMKKVCILQTFVYLCAELELRSQQDKNDDAL